MMRRSESEAVLLVGGAGYVGSHAAKLLCRSGYRVVILDDLSTGHREAARRATSGGPFVQGSYHDRALVARALRDHRVGTVMHFGAKALVSESVENPLKYYHANVGGTVELLMAMVEAGVKRFVFSSTCATFGEPREVPIHEEVAQLPVNPYGRSKLFVESILEDAAARHGIASAILRYFNAAGADPDGELGEDHRPETHLIPLAIRAAADPGARLTVFGEDYGTRDGTCVRDYVHVNDLADAHIRAMERLGRGAAALDFNLGTERGCSVREVLAAVKRATGMAPAVVSGPRRAGDPPTLVADSAKARRELGWQPRFDLDAIVSTAYQWARRHPAGYDTK